MKVLSLNHFWGFKKWNDFPEGKCQPLLDSVYKVANDLQEYQTLKDNVNSSGSSINVTGKLSLTHRSSVQLFTI